MGAPTNISRGKRHRVILQKLESALVATGDADGDEWGECSAENPEATDRDEGWEDVVKLHASLEDLTGRELFEAQQVRAEVNCRVRIRWHKEVKADRRFVFPDLGITVNITAARDKDHRRRELICEGIRRG
jgi:SPP1 family predicted phage head-tail adaptor